MRIRRHDPDRQTIGGVSSRIVIRHRRRCRAPKPLIAELRTGRFPTEQQAQRHCPNETVVWLDLYSGIYHFKGQLWHANTSKGMFVYQKEAGHAGDRATRNGE
jgi:hypothetical protein